MRQQIAAPKTMIPALLEEQGRSVAWLCRKVGIHRSYYWMMETGERPLSAEYVRKASEALGVPVALLVSTSHNETKDEVAA